MKQQLKNIAYTLDQAAFDAKSVEQTSKTQAISLIEAYDIQKLSLENRYARGEQLTGYKLGFTSKAKMEQMGVHDIIWGRLTDAMQVDNGGTLIKANFIHPRVEPEIAFLLSKPLDNQITLENALDYVESVTCALEVIDSRYEKFKFSLEDVVADNCSSTAYVLGDWLPTTTSIQGISIALVINGETNQSGNSNAILGNPIESLVEMSRMASKYGVSVEAGQVILAGAATSAVYLQEGDKVEGQFEGLGVVSLKVV